MRSRLSIFTREKANWALLVSLVLGIVVPAACVVWFMTEAVGNHDAAARQRLSEALHAQLGLLRDRVDADWRARVGELGRSSGSSARDFRRVVTAGRLDSIVFLSAGDAPAYPSLLPAEPERDPLAGRADWRAAMMLEDSGGYREAATAYTSIAARERDPSLSARATQARLRAQVRAGDTANALRVIERAFTSGSLADARDPYGRLIAADAHLLALRLLPTDDPRRADTFRHLAAVLDDYEGTPMPSTQRLFVMHELRNLGGNDVVLPTYEAEQLAAAFLEADGVLPDGAALEASRVPGLWKLAVGKSAVALFRTETVASIARAVLDGQSTADATFTALPPGVDGEGEAIAASALLPGWRISLSRADAERVEQAASRRVRIYMLAGSLGIAVLVATGLLFGQLFHRLARLSRLKTDLVAAVSHELRTPLASVQAVVDLLIDNPDMDPSRAREYLHLIAGEHARLNRMVEHLLTFARVERNRHALHFETVSSAVLVEAVVNAGRFPGLQVEVSPGVPPLHADDEALVTVLVNLLENAYKYSREPRRVALRIFHEPPHVIVEVEDNGIGIARRDQKRIFRPFFQVDDRLARESGGCGLGLSIVQFIVRAHGGQVTLRSEPGAGSCFRIALPAKASAPEVAA